MSDIQADVKSVLIPTSPAEVVVREQTEQVAVRLLETGLLETEKHEHVVVERSDDDVLVIAAGAQGPAGPRGEAGVDGGIATASYFNATTGSIPRCAPVYVHNVTHMKLAASGDVATKSVIGLVADETVLVSQAGTVAISDVLEATTAEWDLITGGSGGLTPGASYFLSATAGRMVTSAPASGYNVKLGVALTSTEFLIRIEPPIKL